MSFEIGQSVVLYTEGGKTSPALVLGERTIGDHSGADGEPLLTLAFVRPRLDAAQQPIPIHGTGQTMELVQVRLDVAHDSHEYTEAQQRFYGKKQYDGGRWEEVRPSRLFRLDVPPGSEPLDSPVRRSVQPVDDLPAPPPVLSTPEPGV